MARAPLLQLSDIALGYGGDPVFDGLDLAVHENDRNDHWIRDKTRYLEAAMEWAGSGRNAVLLLSPTAATAAREWLERRPASEDPPGLAVTEYLEASFAAEGRPSEPVAVG